MLKIETRSLQAAILLSVIILTFSIVFSAHKEYRFPLHVDEWHHLALSMQIMDKNFISDLNPYDLTEHVDTAPGFHLLLSEIFIITGLDPLLYYRFLPAIFASLSSIALFTLASSLTENKIIGVFSMVFFAMLKSNKNIFGLIFFVPLIASIPLVFVFFLMLFQGLKDNSPERIYAAIVIWVSIFLIHPITAALILTISVLYCFVNIRKTLTTLKRIRWVIFIPLAGLLLFINRLWTHWSSGIILAFLDHIVYERGWGKTVVLYSPHMFYGILPFVLAVIGFIILIKRRKYLLPLWGLFTTLNLYIFEISEVTIIAPYQRMFYYMFLSLTILSAVGLYYLLVFVRSALLDFPTKNSAKKYVIKFAMMLLLVSIFYLSFSDYYYAQKKAGGYRVIDEDDYTALKWLGSNYGKNNIVLTDAWTSVAVYPTIENQVVGFMPANIESDKKDDIDIFFYQDCENMLKFLQTEQVDFIVYTLQINCDFLEKIYEDSNYIYVTPFYVKHDS